MPPSWRRLGGVRSPCYNTGAPGDELACLPAVLNLAPPKCGTTDLYYRLVAHPAVVEGQQVPELDVEGNAVKEPKYWLHGVSHGLPVEVYAQVYRPLTRAVEQQLRSSSHSPASSSSAGSPISVDFSATNCFARPAILWRVLPEARFVAVLRDPVRRAESHFNFAFTMYYSAPGCYREHSPEYLHENIVNVSSAFVKCESEFDRESCWEQQRGPDRGPCNKRSRSPRFVLDGLYGISLVRFLDFYPRDRFFLRRLDDLDFKRNSTRAAKQLQDLYEFVGIERELDARRKKMAHTKLKENEQTRTTFFVHLLAETHAMLRDFYDPDLKRLRASFDDQSLSWW